MLTAILIAILVPWTFLGFVVLFNMEPRDFQPNLRLALVVGPIVTTGFVIIGVTYAVVQKIIKWVNQA